MANDITKAISANELKNGSMVVTCSRTGFPTSPSTIVYNTYVKNTPIIIDIESKYDNRFDDPSYYYGGGNCDSGDVGDVLGV